MPPASVPLPQCGGWEHSLRQVRFRLIFTSTKGKLVDRRGGGSLSPVDHPAGTRYIHRHGQNNQTRPGYRNALRRLLFGDNWDVADFETERRRDDQVRVNRDQVADAGRRHVVLVDGPVAMQQFDQGLQFYKRHSWIDSRIAEISSGMVLGCVFGWSSNARALAQSGENRSPSAESRGWN